MSLLKMTYILLRHHAGVRMLRRSLTLLFNVGCQLAGALDSVHFGFKVIGRGFV